MKLTPHFSYEDFDPKGVLKNSPLGKYLVARMAMMSEVVRRHAGNEPILVNNGVRAESDFARLVAAGYNPSPKSDHFYGQQVTVKGITSSTSLGAADLAIKGLRKKFLAIVNGIYDELGTQDMMRLPMQIIYETGANGDWLHLANAPGALWVPDALDAIRPGQRLNLGYRIRYSMDNGKTYKPFSRTNPPAEFK